MARLLKVFVIVFAVLYGLALIALLAGFFSADGGPLSGVFLLPLGLPWNRFIDVFPQSLWPWLAAIAPLPNLAILWILLRLARSRDAGSA